MLEAYLVVPAFALVYLLGAPLGWRKRIGHLLLAGVVMLVISLSWVDRGGPHPSLGRPYVGSSGDNSELELALGYNGSATSVWQRLPYSIEPQQHDLGGHDEFAGRAWRRLREWRRRASSAS